MLTVRVSLVIGTACDPKPRVSARLTLSDFAHEKQPPSASDEPLRLHNVVDVVSLAEADRSHLTVAWVRKLLGCLEHLVAEARGDHRQQLPLIDLAR